jgi:hypothetical protein
MTTILDHVHGVNQQRCGHPDCKAATTRYRKRWVLDKSRGNYRTTSADEVRLHLASLAGAGWTLRAIAGAADVSPQVISHLKDGQRSVTKRIAAAILAVSVDDLPRAASRQTTEPFVPRVGTVRRLQALMAIGWSAKAMGEHLGRNDGGRWVYNLMNQQGRWVTRSTHDVVAAMYRELAAKPGPSEIARRRARRRGFPTPVEWDDIDRDPAPLTDEGDVDEADDDVDTVVVDRVIEGRQPGRKLTHTERVEAVRRMRQRGMSRREIEAVGLKPERYLAEVEGVS